MKKAKLVGILVATLLVGGLIGALATSAVINQRLGELREMSRSHGFSAAVERIIEPTDDAQREAIRAVLQLRGVRFSQLRRAHYQQMRAVIDSTRKALIPLLRDEQRARLEAWFARDHLRDRARHGPRREPVPE